jgi:hypothetical protein
VCVGRFPFKGNFGATPTCARSAGLAYSDSRTPALWPSRRQSCPGSPRTFEAWAATGDGNKLAWCGHLVQVGVAGLGGPIR